MTETPRDDKPKPARRPRIKLPFDNRREDMGSWTYDHRIGLCVTLIAYLALMIIGVGEDGQIGFNEPGSYSRSRTRLVQLTYNTRKIQSGAFFGLENTPKMAVTMGIVMGRPLYVVSSRPTRPALRR